MKLTLFYLEDCPYCHYARRAVRELAQEDEAFAQIGIEWVEESRRPEIAAQYDYYYVPTLFKGHEKLYEAHPSEGYEDVKARIRAAFDRALSR